MDYKRLGKAGLKVSEVCLGTMTFGREADEKISFDIMDYFYAQGGTFFDTSDSYSTGITEEVVGRWIKNRGLRNKIVLATKVYAKMADGPNNGGLSRAHIFPEIRSSLSRLQTDVIDIYQIHRWDPDTPPLETLTALDDLIRQGIVRYIGCSNLKGWQLTQFLYLADLHGLSRFISIQPVYNPLNRGIELEVLPVCEDQGIGVISYNPLAGGMLTGKYTRGGDLPKGARLQAYDSYHNRYYTESTFDIVEKFVKKADQLGVSPAQLALAWSAGEPRITAPILGARTLEQIKDTFAGLELKLSPDDRDQIPAIDSGQWVGM
ncbi:MAG: aldo/keto reductase, partial [Spirochaetales bacterium]|nr:aldo/keto reductase [Spirochaetales bacterium]